MTETTTGTVRHEVNDGIATITLNRPESMNGLDIATKEALLDAVRSAAADDAPNLLGAADLGFPVKRTAGGEADLAAFRKEVESGHANALYVFDPGPEGSIGDVSWIIEARRSGALKHLIVQGVLLTPLAQSPGPGRSQPVPPCWPRPIPRRGEPRYRADSCPGPMKSGPPRCCQPPAGQLSLADGRPLSRPPSW